MVQRGGTVALPNIWVGTAFEECLNYVGAVCFDGLNEVRFRLGVRCCGTHKRGQSGTCGTPKDGSVKLEHRLMLPHGDTD